ncbi:MAG: YciI family protein [Chitinophagaceae bacterium]
MKQYVIIARDGADEDALSRRMQARPVHLAGAAALKANNNFVLGGAFLNEAGQMEGSVMIVQFETAVQFQHWYDNEPYITGGVWKTIEVKPFKVADV